MKLGIYCRISRLKDGNDLSIEDQKKKGVEKANELNIPYQFYIDEGLSGASDKIEDRPEFEKFIGDVALGKITHVFAFDQSRFERNPQIRFIINDLFKKNKITYITHMDGIVDLHDPQAEFLGDMLSIVNKYHVTITKIKVRSVLRGRAAEGKGQAVMPYGYTKDSAGYIIIDEEEAEVVRKIFAMSLKGIGTRKIAETLNEEGIQTRYAKLNKGVITTKNKYTKEITVKKKSDVIWSGNSVRGIIVNPIHKGKKKYQDMYVDVPAIFDEDYWERVNLNLPKNMTTKTSRKSQYEYLLKGLLRCGVCGRNMYGRKRADKHDNHYACSSKRIKNENCGNRSINIDKLDELIWDKLFYRKGFLKHMFRELTNSNKGNKVEDLKTQIEKLDGKVAFLKDENSKAIKLVLAGKIQEDDIADILAENKKEIAITESEIDHLKSALKLASNSQKVIMKYDKDFSAIKGNPNFEAKVKVINDFVKNIIVNYDAVTKEYILQIEYLVDFPNETYMGDLTPSPLTWEKLGKEMMKPPVAIALAVVSPPNVLRNV